MALVFIRNYYDAYFEQVVHNVIRYQSGHLVIVSPGYMTNNNANKFLRDPSAVVRWLSSHPQTAATSTRVMAQGLLSSSQGSANVYFSGVDPKNERQTTKFASNVIRGRFLGSSKKKEIVIGKKLAERLRVGLRSKLVALTQGVDGSIGNELFYVVGIFETQSDWDKALAFVHSEDARLLLSLSSKAVHQVTVVLKDQKEISSFRESFQQKFSKGRFEILTWMDVQKPLMAMIEINKSGTNILNYIILFVASLGIANSILMSILERTREFGVMMAIGTRKRDVIRMVLAETILLTCVGAILGNLFGIALTLYFNNHGFDLAWFTSHKVMVEGTMIQTICYPKVNLSNGISIAMIIFILSMVVSAIPVFHIHKLRTVEALRSP